MKTTKKDFEVFKKECEKWVNFFGLIDYEWVYYHEKDVQARARFDCNWAGRIFSITLSTEWDGFEVITKKDLSFTALIWPC